METPSRWPKLRFLVLPCLFLWACAPKVTPPDFSLFQAEDPKSILVVPVLNNSPEVGASDYFLATVTVPLAERGYYVFPVNLTRALLADAGLADPGLVHSADTPRLGRLFGADAVLYVTITHWEAKYVLVSTTVVVGFEYDLRSAKSGRTLWKTAETMTYTPQTTSSGNPMADLIVMAVQAAITKAAPNYMPLARQANWKAIAATHVGPGQPTKMGFPMLMGPHHPGYRSDRQGVPSLPAATDRPASPAEGIPQGP